MDMLSTIKMNCAMKFLRIEAVVFIILNGAEVDGRSHYEGSGEETNGVRVEGVDGWKNEVRDEQWNEVENLPLGRNEESYEGKHEQRDEEMTGESERKMYKERDERNNGNEPKNKEKVEGWTTLMYEERDEGTNDTWAYISDTEPATSLFYEIAHHYWRYRLRQDPEMATDRGVHDFDSYLENFKNADMNKMQCEDFLKRLHMINSTVLSKADQVEFEVLEASLRIYVDGYQWKDFGYLNPINYIWDKLQPEWFKEMEFRTKEDFQTYRNRLESYGDQLDDMIELMREAMRLNRTNHKASMHDVEKRAGGQIFKLVKYNQSMFNWPMDTLLQDISIDERTRNEITIMLQDTYKDHIYPALWMMMNFLIHEYLPATRPGEGVGSYDGGDEYYQACLQFHITKNYTAEEVRNVALQEVENIQSKIQKVMTNQDFSGTLREFLLHLSTDRSHEFYNLNRYELLSAYKDVIYNRITPKLSNIFHQEQLPTVPISVAFEQLGRTFTNPGHSGYIFKDYYDYSLYFNREEAHLSARFMMLAISLSEAIPGRHLQVQLGAKISKMPYRRPDWHKRYHAVPFTTPDFLGYYEGWSLYAESLGQELGLYNETALELFGHYLSDLYHAALCVVDTGIHKHGLSRSEAINYMLEHTPLSPIFQIELEVDAIITWPGITCAAKMGERVIKQLRNRAEQQLGKHFDVKDFHRVVLDLGRVPLYMLENHVEEWIQKSSAPPSMTAVLWIHVALFWVCYVLVIGYI